MLIVVKYRDVHPLAAQFLNDEAFRGFNVFQIDRAKSWFERANDIGELFGVGLVQLDVKTVDIGEFLKQNGFAFHHRFGRQAADVPKPQNRCAIGYNRNKVPARGIIAGRVRVLCNLDAGFCHARRIGARKVAPICHRFGCADFQLSGFRKLVIVQRGLTGAVITFVGHGVPLRYSLVLNYFLPSGQALRDHTQVFGSLANFHRTYQALFYE